MRSDPPGQVTLCHQAMATDFAITIAHPDRLYARQAAAEAFRELDQLERRLSAYCTESDVSRIARLDAGDSCAVDPATRACLRLALEMEAATGGAFNVAYRSQPHRAASQLIRLGDSQPVVSVRARHVALDLGGIGKGFALDQLAAVLADWDLHRVLLRASQSTVLARRPPPDQAGWEIRFGTATDVRTLNLCSMAFSGSGSDIKGPHIIDPRTGRPATHHRLAFATAGTGAVADALSTEFVVMADDAIREYCQRSANTAAYVVPAGAERLLALHEPSAAATMLSSRTE